MGDITAKTTPKKKTHFPPGGVTVHSKHPTPKGYLYALGCRLQKYPLPPLRQYRRVLVTKSRRVSYLPNMAMKLLLLPIFCTFCAFLSNELGSDGMGGIAGLANGELGVLLLVFGRLSSISGSSVGLCCAFLRFRPLEAVDLECASVALSSLEILLRFSISPSTVVPLVARYSSATPTNRTTPRSGDTPSESAMKFWIRAALRLLVVGWICDGSAVRVRIYAESNVPA